MKTLARITWFVIALLLGAMGFGLPFALSAAVRYAA